MARPKKSLKKTQDPNIQEIIEVEVEFTCPIRGKIKQKVKMKRLKSIKVDARQFISHSNDIENLDKSSLEDEDQLPLEE
jgi:hypothetical protein